MEFFINHSRKEIEFAGENAHLNKFLVKLNELVEKKNWTMKDDIQLLVLEFDYDNYPDTIDTVRHLINVEDYKIPDEHLIFFVPPEQMQGVYDDYDRELARDEARYGNRERSWSGWDTPSVTSDI